MRIVHALQPLPQSIFLAGPTPRSPDVPSWRPEALKILQEAGFDGDVFVPESEDWLAHDMYERQLAWEWAALDRAGVIAFWIPRDLETMPAFTTNVEFGMYAATQKIVLGAPKDAPKMKYLRELAAAYRIPVRNTLRDTLYKAMDKVRWGPVGFA